MWKRIEPFRSSIILLLALIIGATVGIVAPELALKVKPLGQIFLNLLFMVIVPLVGVSVMSSIAEMTALKKLGKLLVIILTVSIVMAIIPAVGVIGLASIFDPAQGVTIDLNTRFTAGDNSIDFVSMFTTNDFVGLFSKSNILPLIIMCILGGIAIGQASERGKPIAKFLNSANDVVMNIVGLIMKGAPLGLGAFFAATMAEQDTELLATFANAALLFYIAAGIYFVIGSIFILILAGELKE